MQLSVAEAKAQFSEVLRRAAAGEVIEVPAVPTTLIDSTGAGDAYAAGFLAAHARGLPLAECGRWGGVAASEVISHFGARPQADLLKLVAA